MKISAIFLSLFIGISLSAQQIEIPSEQYPFYSVIEWKGMGAMLLNRDPSLNTKKVNLTLVGNNPTSIWMQSFNPNGKDFYYISSENARYVYFLDNLKPDMGKIYLHQLNSAGNVKSTSVILSSAIKKLGTYDLSEMELIDVVTTDKALVHIFRYHDVKEKKYIEMATFVTHHNLLVYASIIGEVSEISLKEGNYGYWKYIGFADEQILFAARDYQSRNSGWSVKKFTPKAVMSEAVFIHGSTDNFDKVQNTGFEIGRAHV